jgi:dTDP-4-amino-4,6-dideoxygalactose transaminase
LTSVGGRQWQVPLADVRVSEADIEAVAETYRSGWLSMGPETERLEEAFTEYSGAGEAVAVSSGTAALHLACAAAGLGAGDEVLVPSLTFVATVNAVKYTDARPVFVDIARLDAPWISAETCEAAIGDRTSAIMVMAYGGHSGDIEGLTELAQQRGLLLLEDAAHAAGSRLSDRHLGTFGAAGAFSFFANKNLATGEGGMMVTGDAQLARRARLLRSHGMTTLTWDRHQGHATGYDVVSLGYNYRIDEPRAALARARLARLDDENADRRRLDSRYRQLLADVSEVDLIAPAGDGLLPSHHLFVIVLAEWLDRDAFRSALAARGIQTSVHYPAVHRFSIYHAGAPQLPLTDAFSARAVTLPMFPHMTEEQQDLVIAAVKEAVAGAARSLRPRPDHGPRPATRT